MSHSGTACHHHVVFDPHPPQPREDTRPARGEHHPGRQRASAPRPPPPDRGRSCTSSPRPWPVPWLNASPSPGHRGRRAPRGRRVRRRPDATAANAAAARCHLLDQTACRPARGRPTVRSGSGPRHSRRAHPPKSTTTRSPVAKHAVPRPMMRQRRVRAGGDDGIKGRLVEARLPQLPLDPARQLPLGHTS